MKVERKRSIAEFGPGFFVVLVEWCVTEGYDLKGDMGCLCVRDLYPSWLAWWSWLCGRKLGWNTTVKSFVTIIMPCERSRQVCERRNVAAPKT